LVDNWVTISALATAGGTLVLAGATFASVRSANRVARLAERSLLVGLRPLLMTSRIQDPEQKVGFADDKRFHVAGGSAVAEVCADAIYLVISLRNVGTGIGVLHGWHFHSGRPLSDIEQPPLDHFRRLTRDIYVPVNDIGFWQGAFRDPAAEEFALARRTIEAREPFTIFLLYGDHEGGQRVVTAFLVSPRQEGWIASSGRYWNIDRPDPR
jgi:hypothetical protein